MPISIIGGVQRVMVLYNAAIVTQSASPCAPAWPKIWGLISTGLDWGGGGGGRGGATTRATCSGFAAQAFHSNITLFREWTVLQDSTFTGECLEVPRITLFRQILKSVSHWPRAGNRYIQRNHKTLLKIVMSLLLLTYVHLMIGFFVYPPPCPQHTSTPIH